MATKETVIGTYDNPSQLDLFQTLGQGGDIRCRMDYLGNVYTSSVSGSSTPKIQTSRTLYTITSADVLNGFIPVPITWPTPFQDANYTTLFSIHDLDATIDLSIGELDIHNVTATGCTPVVFVAAAAPLVQGQFDDLNTNAAQDFTFTPLISTLYMITIYLNSRNDGTIGQTIQSSITYTDASGSPKTLASGWLGTINGDSAGNLQPYNFPLYCEANTPIEITTTYGGGGTPFHYDLSIRIVQMPTNAIIPVPGDQFIINAIAVHD